MLWLSPGEKPDLGGKEEDDNRYVIYIWNSLKARLWSAVTFSNLAFCEVFAVNLGELHHRCCPANRKCKVQTASRTIRHHKIIPYLVYRPTTCSYKTSSLALPSHNFEVPVKSCAVKVIFQEGKGCLYNNKIINSNLCFHRLAKVQSHLCHSTVWSSFIFHEARDKITKRNQKDVSDR